MCPGIFGHGNRINPRQSLIKSVTTSTTFSQPGRSQGARAIPRMALPPDQTQSTEKQHFFQLPQKSLVVKFKMDESLSTEILPGSQLDWMKFPTQSCLCDLHQVDQKLSELKPSFSEPPFTIWVSRPQ